MATGDHPPADGDARGPSGPPTPGHPGGSPVSRDTEAPAGLGGPAGEAPPGDSPASRAPQASPASSAATSDDSASGRIEPPRDERSPYATNPAGPAAPDTHASAEGGPSAYAPAAELPYTGYGTMNGQPAYGPGSNPVYGLESPATGEQPYGSPGPRGGWAGPEGSGHSGAPAPSRGPGAGDLPWQNGAPQQSSHRAPVSEPSGHAGYRDPRTFVQPPPQAPSGDPRMPGERRDPRVFAQPEPPPAPSPYPPPPPGQPEGVPAPWNTGPQGHRVEGGPPGAGGHWGTPTQGHQPAPGPHPSLDDVPLRRAKKSPGSGWRKAVHHISGGAINPGMSAEERRLQELVARIRQPVRGDYRIAVLSLKGGVGKTTTTMGLGSIFASVRGDRVIAVDANPDFGTLSQRVSLQTRSTVRDLLLDPSIERYSDVRRHTSQATSRLEVLASERDPAASESFNDEEYRAVARILQRFYNIILTDCGTGLMHSAMTGVLDLAHSLVLVSSAAIDGARSAAATLDWLSLHGHDHLVRNAVVVINLPREGSPNVGVQQLREYFLARCRAVHIIPYDAHLSEGAEIDLHRLSKQAKRAYVELAATVADGFGADHRRFHH